MAVGIATSPHSVVDVVTPIVLETVRGCAFGVVVVVNHILKLLKVTIKRSEIVEAIAIPVDVYAVLMRAARYNIGLLVRAGCSLETPQVAQKRVGDKTGEAIVV